MVGSGLDKPKQAEIKRLCRRLRAGASKVVDSHTTHLVMQVTLLLTLPDKLVHLLTVQCHLQTGHLTPSPAPCTFACIAGIHDAVVYVVRNA